jgi:hypothetical protein
LNGTLRRAVTSVVVAVSEARSFLMSSKTIMRGGFGMSELTLQTAPYFMTKTVVFMEAHLLHKGLELNPNFFTYSLNAQVMLM